MYIGACKITRCDRVVGINQLHLGVERSATTKNIPQLTQAGLFKKAFF